MLKRYTIIISQRHYKNRKVNNFLKKLIVKTPSGLYIPKGNFYIDPTKKVNIAIITHAHSDHAIPGHNLYITTKETAELLKVRISKKINVHTFDYFEPFYIKGIKITFLPAGHILGSAQILLNINGTTVLISGDYKRQYDPTTKPYFPVKADIFVTETTFAHPTYKWKDPEKEFQRIQEWWNQCQKQNQTAVLKVYSLGKAQRILYNINPTSTILVHKTIYKINKVYKKFGVKLPVCFKFSDITRVDKEILKKSLLLVPHNSKVIEKLPLFSYQLAEVSGHFANNNKIKSELHKYFIISDHADYNDIIQTIREVNPKILILTHGNTHFLKYSKEFSNLAIYSFT